MLSWFHALSSNVVALHSRKKGEERNEKNCQNKVEIVTQQLRECVSKVCRLKYKLIAITRINIFIDKLLFHAWISSSILFYISCWPEMVCACKYILEVTEETNRCGFYSSWCLTWRGYNRNRNHLLTSEAKSRMETWDIRTLYESLSQIK